MAEYLNRDALLQAFCNLSTDMMEVYGEPYFEHIDGFSESKVRYIILSTVGVRSGKQILSRILSKMDVENSVDNVEKG